MQHKFNLIEPGDTFSPDPLNENMETLESILAAIGSSVGSGGHTCRAAYGTFTGGGSSRTLTFDFCPLVVALTARTSLGSTTALLVRECTGTTGGAGDTIVNVSWTEDSVTYGSASNSNYNKTDSTIWYVALGV